MKVKSVPIPEHSLLHKYTPANYVDAFECEFITDKKITPHAVQKAFWTIKPPWINWLFKLRDLLVKPFGLRTADNIDVEKFSLVTDSSDNEEIVCLNDKHLKAYLSVYMDGIGDKKRIVLTTQVHFYYWLGYVYFYAICLFHRVVVRSMLKNLVKILTP